MIRPLVIDDAARKAVREVVTYAETPDHWYRPLDPHPVIPGTDPKYRCQLNDYLCVFSITVSDGILFRHLSISVPEEGQFPNPAAVAEIADLFKFTGYRGDGQLGPDWLVRLNTEDNCVIVAQPKVTHGSPIQA